MLLWKEVTHATDLDLLSVLIGDRKRATKLFAKAKFSLFTLLHSQPQENGDLFYAERASAYGDEPIMKLQAAVELAVRSLTEQLQSRQSLTSPGAVRDLLRLKLAGLPHEVFICIQLDARHRVIAVGTVSRLSSPRAQWRSCPARVLIARVSL
jgi:DNA repair protein RadC